MNANKGTYSTSMKNPVKTVYIYGSSSQTGGGTNYWTLNNNNIYNNNNGTVGINTSNPDISYNLDVNGSVRIRGNLLIDGSSTVIDTNILQVEDPLIQLGINNPADLKASGFYTEYRDVSNNKKYTGLIRPPQGTGYVLINNSSVEPSDLYPDISSLSTSYLSVERLAVNNPLSSLSSFYTDISGLTRIWTNRVLIGSNAGGVGQDADTVAIGNNAGNSNQGLNSVAIGLNAAYYLQNPNAIAIGRSAGATSQGQNTVALGYMAGEASQNTGALSFGFQAGRIFQGTNSIAIGVKAGEVNQGCNAIAIGNQAGENTQCNNTIVLNASGTSLNTNVDSGFYVDPIRDSANNKAVYYNTGTKEITFSDISNGGIVTLPQGNVYGEYLLYNGSNWFVDGSTNVSIGSEAGLLNQDSNSIAIGSEAGRINQGSGAIAIGFQAGQTNQGSNSIAIGLLAGRSNFPNNSIYLNASTTVVDPTQQNALYISPIRNDIAPPVTSYPLYYGTSSREVFYNNTVVLSGVNTGDNPEGMYGDGSDATLNCDGTYEYQSLFSTYNNATSTYTLTRDVYTNTVQVFQGYTLITAGYRIFCNGTIFNDGLIHNNGNNANGATAGTGGLGGFFRAGGSGAAGLSAVAAAVSGTAPPTAATNTLVGNYGGRGACARSTIVSLASNSATVGSGQIPAPASGGRKIASSTSAWISPYQINNVGTVYQITPSMGGGSGSKSIVGTGATSGGGGGGGGTMFISAYNLTGSGLFQCLGGNGGNAAGTGGSFGGGGGGAGGIIVLYTRRSVYDANFSRFSVLGGSGGTSVALGVTPTYSVATANGGINTGLIGPSGTGTYLFPFTPTRNLSYNTLYILTVCTTVPFASTRPTILSVTGPTSQNIWNYITTVDYTIATTTNVRMEVWTYLATPTELFLEDIMNDTQIKILFDRVPTTYRSNLDEIQNTLSDRNSVIVQSANSISPSGLTITNTLANPPQAGNMVYTVVTRIAGATPVAGAGNTLISSAAAAPFIISQASVAQQANTQTWATTATIAGSVSLEIDQPNNGVTNVMESGTPGWSGRLIELGLAS